MAQLKPFIAGHEELIHDLSYDFYGKRLVTCSSDQHIKVFDRVEHHHHQQQNGAGGGTNGTNNGSTAAGAVAGAPAVNHDVLISNGGMVTDDGVCWELTDSWKAHDSTIVKVVWANPEFGQVIASCSYDASVRIFEEDSREACNSGRRWKRKAVISEFHGALYDIAFAPSHLGLKLASIDSEGMFHVHEALDPNNLQYWTSLMPEESLVTKTASKHRQSAFALSWCPSMFFKEHIAVSAQDSAYIYQKSENGKYQRVAEFPSCKGKLIRDIAWAPSMGRQFQLIAIASADTYIRIFKVTQAPGPAGNNNNNSNSSNSNSRHPEGGINSNAGAAGGSFGAADSMDLDDSYGGGGGPSSGNNSALNVELISSLGDHRSEVWRVSWNVTGTILASAGNDGNIRFWKASYTNEFQCMAVVSAEKRSASGGDHKDGMAED